MSKPPRGGLAISVATDETVRTHHIPIGGRKEPFTMASKQDRPSNTATMLHSIAEELGCDPELVGVVKKELKLRSRADILHATQERLATMAAQDEPAADATPSDEPKQKKERKASLTLSQRRALLRLLDSNDDGVAPASDFKALPYEHLVGVGYAEKHEADDTACGFYTLTSKGTERAQAINPGYRVWSSGESVAGNENRPVAGTHRAAKAEAEAEADDDDSESDETEASEPVAIEA